MPLPMRSIIGRANENHFERLVVQSGFAGDDVAVDLAAVAVAQDGHVEQAERILFRIFYVGGEQDCAGAGAENCDARRRRICGWLCRGLLPAGIGAAWCFRRRGGSGRRSLRDRRACGPRRCSAPRSASMRACAAKSPWTARIPIFNRAPEREEILVDGNADLKKYRSVDTDRSGQLGRSKLRPYKIAPSRHCVATRSVDYQPRVESRSFSSIWRMSRPGMASPSSSLASRTAFGSFEVGGGFDDGFGAGFGIAGLEDAGADEDGFGAEAANQRGVGGSGDSACGEIRDRQLAGLGDVREPNRAGRRVPWRSASIRRRAG